MLKLSNTSTTILYLLDKIAEGSLKINESVSFSSLNIGFNQHKSHSSHDHPLYITSTVDDITRKQNIKFNMFSTRLYDKNNKAAVLIPQSVLDLYGNVISSFSFKNGKLFTGENYRKSVVESYILSASIINSTVKNLTTPIEITFKISNKSKEGVCKYWQPRRKGKILCICSLSNAVLLFFTFSIVSQRFLCYCQFYNLINVVLNPPSSSSFLSNKAATILTLIVPECRRQCDLQDSTICNNVLFLFTQFIIFQISDISYNLGP